MLLGARLLAAADDTVGVWVAARDLGAGSPVTRDVLTVAQVRFRDGETAQHYLTTQAPLPPQAVLGRDLAAGEMLGRTVVVSEQSAPFELPVVVGAAGAPEDVAVGDVVDVWVAPSAGTGSTRPAERMLTSVPVVRTAGTAGPLGEAATRQVLLGLDAEQVDRLSPMLARMADGTVVLVRHGGTP